MTPQRSALPSPLRYAVGILYLCAGLTLFLSALNVKRFGALALEPVYMANPAFDFYDYLPRFRFLHGPLFYMQPGYQWYYPAPAIFAHVPFYWVATQSTTDNAYATYIVFSLLGFFATACLFARAMFRAGVTAMQSAAFTAAVALCSWPMYFALQRGNIEAFTWLISAAGVWCFALDWLWVAALLIGLAGSIKLYPLLLAGLFLRGRRLRPLLLCFGTAAVITVLGLYFLDPHPRESWFWTSHGISNWTKDYALSLTVASWDHSLFELVKSLPHGPAPRVDRWLRIYYVLAGALGLALFARARRLSDTNLLVLLSCAAIALPPVSFDYTLSNLYIPFAWLCLVAVRRTTDQGAPALALTASICLLAFGLSCDKWLWRPSHQAWPAIAKASALLCLLVLSASYRLGSPLTRAEPAA